MNNNRVYLETFGCQMNVYDTEAIAYMLQREGFEITRSPEDATALIVNTCSVREHAENRAISRLNDLSKNSGAVIAVCGCMAQRMGENLFDEIPGLRIVAGTDSYHKLPEALKEAIDGNVRICLLDRDITTDYRINIQDSNGPMSRYIAVNRGCENYCTYCVVPYLRGVVRSREYRSIIEEINSLTAQGVMEVTLLGQNVMEYKWEKVDFTDLLKLIINETSLPRLRFLTSHPRDVDDELFHLMAGEDRICPHIHLPFQSGSNRILELMNRGYTRESYVKTIEKAREIVPGIAFSTDIIVGFPTETDEDFNDTIRLAETVRFDSAFTFKYSHREGTAASRMDDDVHLGLKKIRLNILNEIIRRIRKEILMDQLGSISKILLDGKVEKGEYQLWKGRTPHFRNVLVAGSGLREGEIVDVVLRSIENFTFMGEVLNRR